MKPSTPAPTLLLRPLGQPFDLQHRRTASQQALTPALRQHLLQRLRQLPRPPQALQHLVSPAFIAHASSADLTALLKGEPVVAARVLATVNAPLYGLGRPVTQLGQAITFLGLHTVRSVCLRHLLEASFPATTPSMRQRIGRLWSAGLLAGELAFRLAQALRLPDPGTLSTHVLLSFVGHLAALALLPADTLDGGPGGQGLLSRSRREQALIGLDAAELGRLLLSDWGLPEPLLHAVDGIDALSVAGQSLDEAPAQAALRAVGYLSARLGERLAAGQAGLPLQLDGDLLAHEDFFHWQGLLSLVALAHLPHVLQAPDLNAALERRLEVLGLAIPAREMA